jgi:hypothetical protein
MDIKSDAIGSWLVIGWFTPDYRPLTEKFAANLAEHGAPFHLFARAKPAHGWDATPKPSVVLAAMDVYPDKTLVLMDVDCIVRGTIAPVAHIDGDVGIVAMGGNLYNGKKRDLRVKIWCSSRVVVFRPTAGARSFVERWQHQIASSKLKQDEHSMVWTFLSSQDVRFRYIDQAYAGIERDQSPDGIIVHESAHRPNRRRASNKGMKGFIRMIERPFRSGKSERRKQERVGIVTLPSIPAD